MSDPTPSRTAREQAQHLQLLVDQLVAGRLWTREDRKDARVLVSLLCEHSLAAERSGRAVPITEARHTLAQMLAEHSLAADRRRPPRSPGL